MVNYYLRELAVPAASLGAFGLLSLLYASNVYGTYLATGAVDGLTILILLRYLASEFLIFGLVVLLVWGQSALSRCAVILLTGLFSVIQFTQYQSMVSADTFLTTDMLQMVGAYEYGATPRRVGLFAVCLVLSEGLLFFSLRALRIGEMRRADRIRGAALVAGLALVGIIAPHGWRETTAEQKYGLTACSPVLSMVEAWTGLLRSGQAPHVQLEPEDLQLARSYGIPLNQGTEPLLHRPAFSTGPLPFARKEEKGEMKQPNVILLLLESFTATLLEPYGSSQKGLTPNLNAMAGISTRVDDYFNHTTPTVRGIAGQLCSIFPYYSHEDWAEATAKLRRSKLLCLPQILGDQGYQTAFLTYMTPEETYIEAQLIDFGYQEMVFRHRLMRTLIEPPPDPDAFPTDRRMFQSLITYLERRHDDQPLFITLSTVGTHTGWIVRDPSLQFGDGTNQVLNTFHNLDRQFGVFWDWFRASRYFDSTVLVVTGDHAIYPHDAVRRAASPGYTNSQIARMGLFIHDPLHDLPAVFVAGTSSIDLAPSLLHLIGAADHENPFIGVSMFSDRGRLRGGPGKAGNQVLLWENGVPAIAEVGGCAEQDHPGHACRLDRVIRYLEWLEQSNRVWRE